MKSLTLSLAAIVATVLASCSKPEKPQTAALSELPVLEIKNSNPITYQDYPASVEGAQNVEIRPQVSGILEKIYVDEGAFVQKGQTLFKIEDQPYAEKLNNAQAAQMAAAGAVLNAQLEVEKLTPLVANKVISDFQLKTANAALTVAKANLQQAKANVASAKINLGYTLIKAPTSGYLGRLDTKQGSLVGPTDAAALTQVSDVHDVHVYFSLSEDDFVTFKQQYAGTTLQEKIKHLPPVSLVLADDSAYAIQGKVDMVDGQFDKTTAAITLRATFPNKNGILRSGNTGKIRLGLQHENVAVVPVDATFEVQDKIFVYTVGDSNKVVKQPIILAGKSGTSYLVKNGLKPKDRVVTAGIDHLQDGQKIQPQVDSKLSTIAYSAN